MAHLIFHFADSTRSPWEPLGSYAQAKSIRSKRLALELLYIMLNSCGPVFRSSEQLVGVLKGSLSALVSTSILRATLLFGCWNRECSRVAS